jgi:hypothetical protein
MALDVVFGSTELEAISGSKERQEGLHTRMKHGIMVRVAHLKKLIFREKLKF